MIKFSRDRFFAPNAAWHLVISIVVSSLAVLVLFVIEFLMLNVRFAP